MDLQASRFRTPIPIWDVAAAP